MLMFHKENTSSSYLFHTSGAFVCALSLKISISTAAINRLAKDTAILVPLSIWRQFFSSNWKYASYSCRIEMGWNSVRRLVTGTQLVSTAYDSNAFLLWYVCVQGCHIH